MKMYQEVWLDYDQTVRRATPNDATLFQELWKEYLEDQAEKGGDIVPDPRSLRTFVQLFHKYTEGDLSGLVLLGARGNAVLMWGDPVIELTLRFGRVAQGWGTYVRPEFRRKGISKQLRDLAVPALREAGFDAVLGTGLIGNEEGLINGVGYGFEIYAQQGVLRLKE